MIKHKFSLHSNCDLDTFRAWWDRVISTVLPGSAAPRVPMAVTASTGNSSESVPAEVGEHAKQRVIHSQTHL